MKAKANELALIDHPVSADDLTLFVINGLGPKYATIIGLILTRETPSRFEELHDLLFEHELSIKNQEAAQCLLLATANSASSCGASSSTKGGGSNRGGNRGQNSAGRGSHSGTQFNRGAHSSQNHRHDNSGCRPNAGNAPSADRSSIVCQLCGFTGHAAHTCHRVPHTANYANSAPASPMYTWLVDSGASHNLIFYLNNLFIHSEYDGIDEVHIADGSGLPISHTGKSKFKFPARTFVLDNILCVPSANQNLLSVSQFTKSNNVSMEFFSFLLCDKGSSHGGAVH